MSDWQASAFVAPDVVEPVIGYREWALIGEELLSPLARTPWTPEPMRAACLPRCRGARGLWRKAAEHEGPAPDPGCVCGIYALFAPHGHRDHGRLTVVRGAVALWGRVEVHEKGMRAEFARVVALAVPLAASRRTEEGVSRVAGRLGIDAVGVRELPAAALLHGRPLNPSLVPG